MKDDSGINHKSYQKQKMGLKSSLRLEFENKKACVSKLAVFNMRSLPLARFIKTQTNGIVWIAREDSKVLLENHKRDVMLQPLVLMDHFGEMGYRFSEGNYCQNLNLNIEVLFIHTDLSFCC